MLMLITIYTRHANILGVVRTALRKWDNMVYMKAVTNRVSTPITKTTLDMILSLLVLNIVRAFRASSLGKIHFIMVAIPSSVLFAVFSLAGIDYLALT